MLKVMGGHGLKMQLCAILVRSLADRASFLSERGGAASVQRLSFSKMYSGGGVTRRLNCIQELEEELVSEVLIQMF